MFCKLKRLPTSCDARQPLVFETLLAFVYLDFLILNRYNKVNRIERLRCPRIVVSDGLGTRQSIGAFRYSIVVTYYITKDKSVVGS